MWAQLIEMHLRAGEEPTALFASIRDIEQPDSGLVRTLAMRDQVDPDRVLMLAVFESEEHARAREADPRRQEGLEAVRANLAATFEGPPRFTDLTVVAEWEGPSR